MASQHGQRQPAQLGATFYPGGTDDFYMPEVVSPAPQRVMPEVPEQIQDKLAYLELDGGPVRRFSGLTSPAPSTPHRDSALSISTLSSEESRGHGGSNLQGPNQVRTDCNSQGYGRHDPNGLEQPLFSPFPRLLNRPTNVPPSDAEKEAILENARLRVLGSNDPEMQLKWAEDTLAYVEIASLNASRDSDNQASRPQTPSIEHQLREDAVNIVSFLADQQHPKADFIKGTWLEFGRFNFRMDKKEAYRCYTRAAQKGYARAEYRIGMQFESSNDTVRAIKHYSQGVEAGDSASHYRLGMMTLLGQHGQPLDYERGIKLISFAAETADENAPQGAYVYGMLQAREIAQVNVPEQYLPLNIGAARFHIEKAAYLGFGKAQTKMGAAYELCQLGCDFDPALSLHYNALAARQGEPDAEMSISKWFLCGYDGIFEKNDELAFMYARRATQNGLATAEFAMGYFYEIGINVPVDLMEAKSWYRKASEHGNKDASARIEGISRSHTLSRKDHENVAIARIKSQYGSQKGRRPERFRNNPTPMPTIPDNPITMPEPYQSQPLIDPRFSQHTPVENGPQRPISTASQRPISAASQRPASAATQRPVSTAPYPVENDSEPRLKPRPILVGTSSYPEPYVRLNPDPRPNSAASMGPIPRDNIYRVHSPAIVGAHRPMTSLGDMGNNRGRGTPTFNTAPGAQGYRQPSGTLASPQITSPAPGAQGYRQPSGPLASPEITPLAPGNASRPQSGIDIGFSAPPDPSGADRKRRLQKTDNPGAGTSRPLPTSSTYEAPASRDPPRGSSLAHGRTFSPPAQGAGPGRPPISSNSYYDSAPNHMGPGSPINASSMLPPNKPIGNDKPAAALPPGTATRPASTATRPPGKGPQTFQEMGVPEVKKENECTVM